MPALKQSLALCLASAADSACNGPVACAASGLPLAGELDRVYPARVCVAAAVDRSVVSGWNKELYSAILYYGTLDYYPVLCHGIIYTRLS